MELPAMVTKPSSSSSSSSSSILSTCSSITTCKRKRCDRKRTCTMMRTNLVKMKRRTTEVAATAATAATTTTSTTRTRTTDCCYYYYYSFSLLSLLSSRIVSLCILMIMISNSFPWYYAHSFSTNTIRSTTRITSGNGSSRSATNSFPHHYGVSSTLQQQQQQQYNNHHQQHQYNYSRGGGDIINNNILDRNHQYVFRSTKRRRKRKRISTSLLLISKSSASTISDNDDDDGFDTGTDTDTDNSSVYDPNDISPKTKTITGSMIYFGQFLVRHIISNRLKKQEQQRKEEEHHQQQQQQQQTLRPKRKRSTTNFVSNIKKLNEQRKNLITLAGYNSKIVIPSFTFLFLGALTTSIVPLYEAKCIQLVATLHPTKKNVIEALVGLIISSTLASLFTGLRGSLFWLAGSRANYNIRVKLHRSLLLQEAAFFDSNEVGYLLSRLNNDVNKIGNVISYHVNVVCRQLAQFLFGSVVLWRISKTLSMWAFAGVGLVAILSALYGDFARMLAEKVQDTFADSTAVAETSLSMSETIRSFNGVEIDSKKYEASQGLALELEEVQAFAYGSHKFVSDTLQSALHAGLLFACWTLGRAGGLEASQLTTFMFYTNFVLESSNEVGDQWAKIQSAVGASTSVFDLIRRIPAIRDPPKSSVTSPSNKHKNETEESKMIIPIAPRKLTADEETSLKTMNGYEATANSNNVQKEDDLKPVIEMYNMTVTYGAMVKPALDCVDLKIYPGDRVAVVGRSGSGKSSMLRTILRFYDPSSGAIYLGGEKMTQLTRQEIARKVAVVEQEPSLFPMSLLDNVLYGVEKDSIDPETGEPCYSETYREAAAKSLKICGLPVEPGNDLSLELDTRVGEGGRALSGGQRQRTAIARALIRSPEVLLLDEPTAALDSESERKVVVALQRAMVHAKSMVMVTHRLGVVRKLNVNRVIVMDQGKIVESGHPEELLRLKGGQYASLALEQGITASSLEAEEEPSHL